jgi:predicted nucleotidyltransferase
LRRICDNNCFDILFWAKKVVYNPYLGYNNLYKGYLFLYSMTSLLRFLIENPNSRKIFGERELKIIEKQLNGINLTQSEKNRLSRDIRKKLDFIKEAARFEKEFELKKGSEIKKLTKDAVEIILEHPLRRNIQRILLFGSTVKNQLTVRSDIDIAVEFEKIDLKEATKFRIEISGRVSDKIDIQVFNVLPENIKESILNNHKTLYKKDGENRPKD